MSVYNESNCGSRHRRTEVGEMDEPQDPVQIEQEEEYVEFARAGTRTVGEFECTGCGYAMTVLRRLPRCPSCGEAVWERSLWSPFGRTFAGLRSRLS